jgi:hypothetical protein
VQAPCEGWLGTGDSVVLPAACVRACGVVLRASCVCARGVVLHACGMQHAMEGLGALRRVNLVRAVSSCMRVMEGFWDACRRCDCVPTMVSRTWLCAMPRDAFSDVPARLGLKATALAWPETALASENARPGQSH